MIRFAEALISLSITAAAMSMLITLTEMLLPKGPVRTTVNVAAALLYLEVMLKQIGGIIGRNGV